MKRYDKSEIMRAAHKFFRTGKYTMSEALKKSWKMAKFNVWMKEQSSILKEENRIKAEKEAQRLAEAKAASIKAETERAERRAKAEAKAAEERAREERAAKEMGISFDEYQRRLSEAMGYGTGRYCGD